MPYPPVILIQENTGLGQSLRDLLEAEGLEVHPVNSLEEPAAGIPERTPGMPPVLVLASNQYRSPTVRAWKQGRLDHLHLLVVGTRDPALQPDGRLHVVGLPLDVARFLLTLQQLSSSRTSPSTDV